MCPEEYIEISVGDELLVKTPNARCTSQWQMGVVTGVNSDSTVEVNGLPRHTLVLRRVVCPDVGGGEGSSLFS